MLTTPQFWVATLQRAARTALVFFMPFLPDALAGNYGPGALTAALGAIVSILKSVVVLPPEVSGEALPWWRATAHRVLWSAAQGLLSGIGTSSLLTDVDWSQAFDVALAGAAGSFLLALISTLPETPGEDPATMQGIRAVGVAGGTPAVYGDSDGNANLGPSIDAPADTFDPFEDDDEEDFSYDGDDLDGDPQRE